MDYYLTELFDLLVFVLKAATIGLVIFFVLRRLTQWIHNSRMQSLSLNVDDDSRNIKLQAYERLSLYIQRISIPEIIYRLRKKDMSAKDLNTVLLVSIQKELEHNNTQQIYVSEKLWQIINIAKDETVHIINQAYEEAGSEATDEQFIQKIIEKTAGRKLSATDKALSALKKEVDLILR